VPELGISTPDTQAVQQRYFAAWEARDPDAIAALHTEDTVFWSRLGSEPVRGRDAVRQTFAELFERFPQLSFETNRLLFGPDFWVFDWVLKFVPEGAADAVGFDAVDVVQLSPEGLVARKDTFVDLVQAQAAVGTTAVAA
jgi:uncharacterized protein (TIGR02246 family)